MTKGKHIVSLNHESSYLLNGNCSSDGFLNTSMTSGAAVDHRFASHLSPAEINLYVGPYHSVSSNNYCLRFFWRSPVRYQKVYHPLWLYEKVAT